MIATMAVQLRDRRLYSSLAHLVFILYFVSPSALGAQQDELERQIQHAKAAYDAGQYDQALLELKPLLAHYPDNFLVNEMMGLTYASQGDDKGGAPFLRTAVRLQPRSAAARTSLAVSLARLRLDSAAESEFKQAAELEPSSYETNHNLGEFYIQRRRAEAAIPFLEAAQHIDPSAYANGYDLAIGYIETRNLSKAAQHIRAMIQRQDTAELHSLLGEVEEKSGQPIEAVNEYQRAVQMDPSEKNIFDLGTEMLLHQTLEPAVQVFTMGTERFPQSPRMQIGLGIALHARGLPDKAVSAFLRATELAPNDPRPYLFLGRLYNTAPAESELVLERLARLTRLQPRNAQAWYYYAMSLWKGSHGKSSPADLAQVESVLKTAAALDPSFPASHLQLGNLYAAERKLPAAIEEYKQTVKFQPELDEAHFRLAQAYARTGEKEQAQKETAIYDRLHQRKISDIDRRRKELKVFVYSLKEEQDQ
jgi:tetratricopeptide (TPR) repeat protein